MYTPQYRPKSLNKRVAFKLMQNSDRYRRGTANARAARDEDFTSPAPLLPDKTQSLVEDLVWNGFAILEIHTFDSNIRMRDRPGQCENRTNTRIAQLRMIFSILDGTDIQPIGDLIHMMNPHGPIIAASREECV